MTPSSSEEDSFIELKSDISNPYRRALPRSWADAMRWGRGLETSWKLESTAAVWVKSHWRCPAQEPNRGVQSLPPPPLSCLSSGALWQNPTRRWHRENKIFRVTAQNHKREYKQGGLGLGHNSLLSTTSSKTRIIIPASKIRLDCIRKSTYKVCSALKNNIMETG